MLIKQSLIATLLFTSTLYSMEKDLEPNLSSSGNIATEAETMITQATNSNDNLCDNIFNAIMEDKRESIAMAINSGEDLGIIIKAINTHTHWTDLKEFTTLIHRLCDKFPEQTPHMMSNRFTTPIAEKYMDLGCYLLKACGTKTDDAFHKVKELIEQGADVNFTVYRLVNSEPELYATITTLLLATQAENMEIIKLLYNSGLNIQTLRTTNKAAEDILTIYIEKKQAIIAEARKNMGWQ